MRARRRGERAGGTPARMRTHGRHAPSPCSLTPSLPCPRFQFRSFPRTQELLNSASLFPSKNWDRAVFCFSVCRMLRFRLRRCTASKARRRRRKIVPDPPGGFLCHCAPKRFKIDGRISLSFSVSDFVANFISSVFFSRIRLALFPRACPSSKPDGSRVLRCPKITAHCSGNEDLTKIKDDTSSHHGQDSCIPGSKIKLQ